MKQLLVGLGVLVALVAYSFGVRHDQAASMKPVTVTLAPKTTVPMTSNNASLDTTTPAVPPSAQSPTGLKNGTYTGSVEDAFYGNVQVSATISGRKLTAVTFLQSPDEHPDSIMINQDAMPLLQQEAIQKQSANVDIISGATFTSQAFVQSLSNALSQAQSA